MKQAITGVVVLGILCGSAPAGHAASPSAQQILHRSSVATGKPAESRTESDVRIIGSRFQGHPALTMVAHVSADCTGSTSKDSYQSAQQIVVTGTARSANGRKLMIDTHWIVLSSGLTSGNSTGTTFWERSPATGGKWRKVSSITREPAYAAYLSADACPQGGEPFRVAEGGTLKVTGTSQVADRPVWNLSGVAQSSSMERFTYLLAVDRATYLLIRSKIAYVEKVQGQVVVRQYTTATYSRYGVLVSITAPKAGATTP